MNGLRGDCTIVVVVVAAVALYFGLIPAGAPLYIHAGDSLKMQDFFYHLTVADYFWNTPFPVNIYALNDQRQALQGLLGVQIAGAMPIGLTPLYLLLWYPFIFVSAQSAYWIWVGLQTLLLGWAFVRAVPRGREKGVLLGLTAAAGAVFLSETFFNAVMLGQASILGTALLAYLAVQIKRSHRVRNKSGESLELALAGLLLWIKPTYGFAGLCILIGHRRWYPAFLSLFLAIVCVAGLAPDLTPAWLGAYEQTLASYESASYLPAYELSMAGIAEGNFRPVLAALLPDQNTADINFWVFRGVFFLSLYLVLSPRVGRGWGNIVALFPLAGYLLFAPYLGQYENLLLTVFLFPIISAVKNAPPPLLNYTCVTLLLLILNSSSLFIEPVWVWALKFSFVALALYAGADMKEERL